MSPDRHTHMQDLPGFPRVSGDEPICHYVCKRVKAFSPRERG